jgi:hypothetical protein
MRMLEQEEEIRHALGTTLFDERALQLDGVRIRDDA